jgi:DnaD/phage-associated family protein
LIAQLTSEAGGAISERAYASHPAVADAGEVPGSPAASSDWPWTAVDAAAMLGLIVRFTASSGGIDVGWLMLNTERNVATINRLVSGAETPPETFWIDSSPPVIQFDRPTVFRLYEQNIGPLTPLIAQQVIKATDLYPISWIEDAIGEAVAYNRRSWRYIARILENRAADGPPDQR